MAGDGVPLTDTSASTPLVLAPIEKGGQNPTFDPGPYGDKFIYGRVDGSSVTGEIDENGHAKSQDGKSPFRTGPRSLFGKDTPVIKTPTGIN